MKYAFIAVLVLVLLIALSNVRNVTASSPPAAPAGTHHTQQADPQTSHIAQQEAPITGPPTITAAFIDQVLTVAHSPAVGLGQAMYDLGVQFRIDPAYALAFFHHESDYGKYGVAAVTHSIGNIRCSANYSCYDGYRAYPTWAAGVRDWYTLLENVYLSQGLNTVARIIPVYAPAADHNDEAAYIASVLHDVVNFQSHVSS